MVGYRVDIYENDSDIPTLSHVFWGNSREDARGISEAHMHTDTFYRGAMERGEWHGIPLTVKEEWI
jgi:hypothetical protein